MAKTSMSNVAATAVLSLLPALLALPASAEILQVGRPYSGGTTLEAPQYGVTFTLPEEWIGALPPDSALFLMKAEGAEVEAEIYAGIEKLTLEEARGIMNGEMDAEGGVVFHPRGKVRVEDSMLSGEYSVSGSERMNKGWVRTIVSEHGWGVSFLAHSTPEDAELLRQALDALCRSVKLTEPAPPE